MPNLREASRTNARLSALIAFVRREGWTVSRPLGRRIVLSKAGLSPIFTGMPCDRTRLLGRDTDDAMRGSGEGTGHA